MTVNRLKFRPGGVHRLRVTRFDCEHYGQELPSEMSELTAAIARALEAGDADRARLLIETKQRRVEAALAEARRVLGSVVAEPVAVDLTRCGACGGEGCDTCDDTGRVPIDHPDALCTCWDGDEWTENTCPTHVGESA